MQLIKFDPLKDMRTIENEVEKMLSDGWDWVPENKQSLSLDMYEEDGKLITEVSLPQFKKKDIQVSVDKSGIEISAHRSAEKSSKPNAKRRYYHQETSQSYWRRASLPPEADWSKAEAKFEDGILNIQIPLDPSKSTRLLEVK